MGRKPELVAGLRLISDGKDAHGAHVWAVQSHHKTHPLPSELRATVCLKRDCASLRNN
jgi:hypothetical protein